MATDDLEEIKRRIDIVDLISQYIQLKKSGRNFKALCPFHTEKTPSFMVSPEKQIYKCFGCQKSGDVFTFLMEFEGIEFAEALKQLAERAGVKLKPQDPRLKKEKEELYLINSMAAKLFHHILTKTKAGSKPLAYLKSKRGLTNKTIADFQTGYALDNWDFLSRWLVQKGFVQNDIIKSGLVIAKDNRGFYDRFRSRIMFPVANVAGSVVGFSGRIFDQIKPKTLGRDSEPAKYINSPDTPIYNKSQIIYGLNLAKPAIREKNQIIIVEGQMDVVSCHQAGLKNTVASSGTALTLEQINHLKKFSENLLFAFDPDAAGVSATKRAIETAHQVDLFPKIILTPSEKDPADWLKTDRLGFEQAVKKALPVIDFYFEKAKIKFPKSLSPQDKKAIAQEILPFIKDIADPVPRADYLKKLAKFINLEEKYLLEALSRIKAQKISEPAEIKIITPDLISPKIALENKILGISLAFPKLLKKVFSKISSENFLEKDNLEIAKILEKLYYKSSHLKEFSQIRSQIPADYQKRADILVMAIEREFEEAEAETIAPDLEIYLSQLKSRDLEKIKQEFQEKIAEAEKSGDRPKIKKLLIELQQKISKI